MSGAWGRAGLQIIALLGCLPLAARAQALPYRVLPFFEDTRWIVHSNLKD